MGPHGDGSWTIWGMFQSLSVYTVLCEASEGWAAAVDSYPLCQPPRCYFCVTIFFKSKKSWLKKIREKAHLLWSSEVNKNKIVVYGYLKSGYLEVTDLFGVSQRAEIGWLSWCFQYQMTLLVINWLPKNKTSCPSNSSSSLESEHEKGILILKRNLH